MSHLLSVPEKEYRSLQSRAARRQATARAEGTEKGRRTTIRQYLRFTRAMHIDPLHPSHQDICGWIEVRVEAGDRPLTVRNKVSHLRVYATLVGTSLTPFTHTRVDRAVDSLIQDKSYKHTPTKDIPVRHLRTALRAIPAHSMGRASRAALLLMYHGALRQSEVLPPSVRRFNVNCHPTRDDVTITKKGLHLKVKWAKNMQAYTQKKLVFLTRAKCPKLGVVAAVQTHIKDSPTTQKDQPLFTFPHTTRPIPVTYVRRVWQKALEKCGMKHKRYTMHSIRRAAATQAHMHGCSELDIQNYGGWASNAHRVYIKKTKSRQVNAVICDALSK